MLSLTHSSVGAAAGKYIPNPVLAFLAGIFLHFVFDKIPHFWPGKANYQGVMLVLDTVATTAFIAFLILYPGIGNRYRVVGGAIGGAFVDLCLVLTPKLNRSKLAGWHSARQTHLRSFRFILNDLVIIAATMLVTFWIPA